MSIGKRVLAVGSPIIDLLVLLDDKELAKIGADKGAMTLTSHEKQENILGLLGRKPAMTPGGSAGNTAFALARLGVNTSLFGKVGLDLYGQFYVQEFCRLGGKPDFFRFTDKLPTARCLSMITPDAERTMYTHLSAAADMEEEAITQEELADIDLIYFEGYMLSSPALETVLRSSGSTKAEVVIDLGDFRLVEAMRERLNTLLPDRIDIVFANELEAAALFGEGTPLEHVKKLGEHCRIAVVKTGKDGCIIKKPSGDIVKVPGIEVKAVDTTAAGDLFQAGFLYGYLEGCELEDCARFGNILGSEVVQVVGTVIQPGPWEKAVEKMVIKHKGIGYGL